MLAVLGASGSGKTTLLVALLPALRRAGLRVSTIKHAHHGADLDRPGKDSFRHREAGAEEVMVAMPGRWALLRETPAETAALPTLLARMAPVDLVLVEGFRDAGVPALEVHRAAAGQEPLWPRHPAIVAVATDAKLPGCDRTLLDLPALPGGSTDAVAQWIMRYVAGPPRPA